MIDEKKLTDILFDIKLEALESDRDAAQYAQGYYYGRYSAITEIERVLNLDIPVTDRKVKK